MGLNSCKKDKEEEKPIVGTWKVISHETRQGNEVTWQPAGEPCKLDNTEVYEADGKWTLYEGTKQCSQGTGVMKGTWKLAASDTKVVYTYDGVSGEYESSVEELNANKLVLTNSAGDLNNTQYRTVYTKN